MSANATGTPTTLGIPKFNTSSDAPNGKGVNEMMDAIDSLLAGHYLTNTGDLLYASAANTPARLAIGTNNFVLTSNGTIPTWAAASSGAVTKIQDILLGSGNVAFDFTSIPSSYLHLRIIFNARSSEALGASTTVVQFNNDGGTNYDYEAMGSVAGTATTYDVVADNKFGNILVAGGNATANYSSNLIVDIPNYASTAFFKTAHMTFGAGSPAANKYAYTYEGFWKSTAAINRVTITDISGGTYNTGSRATLYGIS